MQTEQVIYTESDGWVFVKQAEERLKASLVLVFGHKDLLREQKHYNHLKQLYPEAEIVGCSTAGEISNPGIRGNSLVCSAVRFEHTRFKVVKALISQADESFMLGRQIADQLFSEDLTHVMILSEGININGSDLTRGLNDRLGLKVPVTGGLAGDQSDFSETYLIHNGQVDKNLILGLGFYGDHIRVGYGSMGGWDSFGVDRLVTKAKANVLFELDGQPALELYKKYLGHHAGGLPASAMLFPLSLRFSNSDKVLVRTILSVDEENGSMTFAGDIPEGEYVRLMKASFEKLVQGAGDAAQYAVSSLGFENPDLAILISCVGRRLVLKQRTDEEVDAVKEELGMDTTITGFYSYGEICPHYTDGKQCELHNQTMTITLFREL
jgi:hypothetical protein